MISKHFGEKQPVYYLFDTATQQYLGSNLTWAPRGAQIRNTVEVRKILRVLAERKEEAARPGNWLHIPHYYEDVPAFSYIPESIAVVDAHRAPLFRGRDLVAEMIIQAWRPKTTN